MMFRVNARRWLALGVGAVLGAGLLTATAAPASAQRYTSRYSRTQDWDRDGIPNWRDANPRRYDRYRVRGWRSDRVYSRSMDRDRDGVPNYRDRHPNNPRRR